MAVETESFIAGNGTDITGVGSGIWSYASGSSSFLFVTSNEIRHKVNTNQATIAARAGTFNDDQYAQIQLTKTSVSQSYIGVGVRATAGAGYFLYVSGTLYVLGKIVSYGYNEIRVAARTFNVGDIIRLEVSGTTLTCKQNGSTFWTATDSSHASGNPAVTGNGFNATDFNAGDDWEGGDLASVSLQSWQYNWPHQLHVRR